MSQENVEIAKALTEALNRLDVDAWAELSTADFEWFPVLGGTVEGKSFRGPEGIEDYFGELRDTWEEFRVIIDEFRDLGDSVLALGRLEARGRGSGVPVALPLSVLGDYREGRIWRSRAFSDFGEALRAAGVEE
ncbi:MAG TPA: nuclear transport factor 2 family protein [Solirubrobacteraceae bacterium]|nr:nuclear transport factor 2 family protein [Solirubrobacteraceae bacterium]